MIRGNRALCLLALTACGAAAGKPGATDPHHGTGNLDDAALPFRVLHARGGSELEVDRFFADLAARQVVCIGEHHPNPHHHWAQLMILRKLAAAAGERGAPLALGLEMFQRPFQGVLDDFAAGRIDEAALLSRSGWADRWGYDWWLYQPMVALAAAGGHKLLALNAPGEVVKKVARQGLDALTPDERKQMPPLHLDSAEHRAWFRDAMQGHGEGMSEAGDAGFENFYTAQVIWDESMAAAVIAWWSAGQQAVILAGTGHCQQTGIPLRLAAGGLTDVVSVLPVLDDGQGAVADALAAPETDFLIVMDAAGAR